MRKLRWELILVALGALSLGAGCPLIPQIKDKIVELAVGGSAVVSFEAVGSINTYNETKLVDIKAGLDLAQVLDDAGVDVQDVEEISLSGVAYRVTRQDPTANRQIQNGQVTVEWTAVAPYPNQPQVPVVTNFNVDVNSATGWQTATLDAAGVGALNDLLEALLAELQGGPVAPSQITVRASGTSTPTGVATDFTWELRLDVSIVGDVEVTTIE